MQYLANKHGLEKFYPKAPAKRAMIDSAMFYLIGTLYPYVARATYPALGFPQYAGEVGHSDAHPDKKSEAQKAAAAAIAEPLEVFHSFFRDGKPFIGGKTLDRRHPPGGDARVPGRHRLRAAHMGERVYGGDREEARQGLCRARRRRARLYRPCEVAAEVAAVSQFSLLPTHLALGEGARRADEGREAQRSGLATCTTASLQGPSISCQAHRWYACKRHHSAP